MNNAKIKRNVKVEFYKGSASKIFQDVINIYSKDDMLCLRSESNILKIPLIHVKQISYKNLLNNSKSSIKIGADVKILFYRGSSEKIFNNVLDVSSKDDMLRLETEEYIYQIPLVHILYVYHKHGSHMGANGII